MAEESKTAASQAAPVTPKRRRRGTTLCLLGLLLAIAGLAASRLGRLWIAFDVFAQFSLQFAILAIAFAVGYLMPRVRLLMATVLAVGGLALIGAWPHYVSGEPALLDTAKPGERDIRVASFNAHYANGNRQALKAEIERLDADVLVLIELFPDTASIVKEVAQRYPHRAECFDIDYCHMAILAKFPILGSEARVQWEGAPMIKASFGPELGGLTVMGVHTIRFPYSRAQFRQVTALSNFVETIPGRKIVMGDFNATPYSRITQTFAQRTGLVRLTELPTWPSFVELPQLAIDHIFASPDIRPTEAQRIGNPAGSDHYPITMKVAVPLS